MPVNSAIATPQPGALLRMEEDVCLRGWAYSGGGRAIIRVDVSADGGATWHTARLDEAGTSQPPGKAWAWTLWEVEVPLPGTAQPGEKVILVSKAVDESLNVQPESLSPNWNLRGLATNSWYRVECVVAPRVEEEEE